MIIAPHRQVVNGWHRVSREEPCPICGKNHNCNISDDGGAVWCGRVSDGATRTNTGGQYLHFLGGGRRDSYDYTHPGHLHRGPQPIPTEHVARFRGLIDEYFSAGQRKHLARQLGVAEEILRRLGVGFDRADKEWAIPERNAAGDPIGYQGRDIDGKKRNRGKRGLVYDPDTWHAGQGPLLLVEGATDTAAAIDLGLSAIGRPSCRGGVDLLAEMLTNFSYDREIIVIGERDQKPNGDWPGRDGAIATASQLSERLGRAVGWSLIPSGKDLREWRSAHPHATAAELLAGLDLTWIDIAKGDYIDIDPEQLEADRQAAFKEARSEPRPKSRCCNPTFVPKTNGKRTIFVACDCRGSGCKHCRITHRLPPAVERIKAVLGHDSLANKTLHYANVECHEVKSLSKHFTRERSNAIRIAATQACGFALLISDKPFPGSEAAPEWKIRERVSNQVWQLELSAPPKGQHILTLFGSWRKPEKELEKEPSIAGEAWETVPAAKSKALRQQAARELGLEADYSELQHRHGLLVGELIMPDGLSEDEHRELAFRWGILSLSLERESNYKAGKSHYNFAPKLTSEDAHAPPPDPGWNEI